MDSVVLAVLVVVSLVLFGTLFLSARSIAAGRARIRSGDSLRRAHDHESGLFDPDCARCAEPFLVVEQDPAESGVREKDSAEPKRKEHAA
jgi:hypothetical protein